MTSAANDDFRIPVITDEIIDRYRQNYDLPPTVAITREMVHQHAELEHRLTERLIKSTPDNRTAVWVESYGTLYHDLPWLAAAPSTGVENADLEFGHFLKLIPANSTVIEIGSGAGSLSRYLTEHGRPCVATDITEERGGTRQNDTVEWHATDGVHLEEYEDGRQYDVVLSTQVIEHLHPDDVELHLRGAFELLKPGGSYVFNTPHVFMGPADLSRVFAYDRARFMHLKEYTHRELAALARRAGFKRFRAVYVPPIPIRAKVSFMLHGRWLYTYLTVMERLIEGRRMPKPVLRALLFHCDVFLVAIK